MASVLPEDARRAIGAATGGGTPAPPADPRAEAAAALGGVANPRPTITRASDPVLARHGFPGSIRDFNERVEAAAKAAEDRIGYRPAPGLIFDLVRSPLEKERFPDLFGSSPSKRRNAAETVLSAAGAPRERRAEDRGPGFFAELGGALSKSIAVYGGPSGITPENPPQPSADEVWSATAGTALDAFGWFGDGEDPASEAQTIASDWKAGKLSYGDLVDRIDDNPALQREVGRLLADDSVPGGSLPAPMPGTAVRVPGLAPADPKLLAPRTPEQEAADRRSYLEAWATYSVTPEMLRDVGATMSGGLLGKLEQGGDFVAAGVFGADRDNLVGRTFYQVGQAALLTPLGAFAAGQAVVLDAKDAILEGDTSPERTVGLAKSVVESTIEDFRHPLENPGYLLMDVFSVVSGAAGAGARLGAAAKGARAAESVAGAAGAVVKGLVFRPPPGQAIVAGEFINLSENAAARAVQRIYYKGLDRRLAARTGPEGEPFRSLPDRMGMPGFDSVSRLVRRYFSAEQTYSRAVNARIAYDQALASFRAGELERITQGAVRGRKDFERMMERGDFSAWWRKQRRQTRIGVDKAIQVIASDIDPDPLKAIEVERKYHRDAMANATELAKRYGMDAQTIAKNHRAQLLALDEAEKVVKAQRPEFTRALEETRALSQLSESMRSRFGLTPEAAQERIARTGAIIRGEPVKAVADPAGLIKAEIDRLNESIRLDAADAVKAATPDESAGTVAENVTRPRTPDEATGRIGEIDKVYDDLLGKFYDLPPGWKGVLAKRNALVGKLRREGKLSEQDIQARATAKFGNPPKQDALRAAEDELAAAFRKATDGKPREQWPESVRRVLDMLDERDRLSRGLGKLDEIKQGDPFDGGGRLPTAQEIEDALGLVKAKVERPRELWLDMPAENDATRVARLQAALDDPRLVADPEGLLRSLGIPFTRERIPLTPATDAAFYVKSERAARGGRTPNARNLSMGTYGIAPADDARLLPEMRHTFDGDSIHIGDYRIDATTLTAEQYKRTVRAMTVRAEHARLWEMATKKPGPYSIPIRDVKAIPEELRAQMGRLDEQTWNGADADFMKDEAHADLLRQLFPGRRGKHGRWEVDPTIVGDGENVRWVDERLLFDRPGETYFLRRLDDALTGQGESPVGRLVGSSWSAFNEVVRSSTLFLRPAYALNALGSTAMLAVQQGFLAPVNFGRALTSSVRYGDDVSRWLDTLAGQTRTSSLVDTRSKVTIASSKLSDGWSVVTDRFFRRAAVIHELRRQGIGSPEEMRAAMKTTDSPELNAKIREASKRAKRAMVEFDNLNPFERSVLRHLVFIYAWWSRSAVWSARFLVDHPIQADIASAIGQASEEQMDALLGDVPEVFKRMQLFVTGYDDDADPTVRSLNWLLPTTGWTEAARPFLSLVQGKTPGREMIASAFGPGAELALRVASGRDQFGREYEDGALLGAAKDVASQTPAGAFLRRRDQLGEQVELPAVDPTNRKTLVQRENAARKQPMFRVDGWQDVVEPLILGGLAERTANRDSLNARYWAEQTPEARHKHQMNLIRQGLDLQAGLLGEELPREVSLAAQAHDEFAWRVDRAETDNGPAAVTLKEKVGIRLDVLRDLGVLDPEDEATLRAKIGKVDDPVELRRLSASIVREYAGGQELADWNTRVRTVGQFRQAGLLENVGKTLEGLDAGTFPTMTSATPEQRDEYGRGYLDYLKQRNELEEMTDQEAHGELTSDERASFRRRIQILDSEYSDPVTIDGITFPSYAETRWALRAPDTEQRWLNASLKSDWGELSTWEKKALLGRDVEDHGRTWASFDEYVARQRELAKTQGIELADGSVIKSIGRPEQEFYAKQFDAKDPGFYRDWKLAQQPRVRRMISMRYFAASSQKNAWYELFGRAEQYAKYLDENQTLRDAGEFDAGSRFYDGEMRQKWREDAVKAYEWYRDNRPDFYAEVNRYGGIQFVIDLID